VSYLLFMDESGHDHKSMPYEVRGGVAIHASKIWSFASAFDDLQVRAFGARLEDFGSEIKGEKLFDKRKLKNLAPGEQFSDSDRRRFCLSFLQKGAASKGAVSQTLKWQEFRAYAETCREMSLGILDIMRQHDVRVFATAIPRGSKAPPGWKDKGFLRKDHAYLFERFFYYVEQQDDTGILVLDSTEYSLDHRFLKTTARYFTRHELGRQRAAHIVPVPMFTPSHMSSLLQSADVIIYCINWGFRVPLRDFNAPNSPEISEPYAALIGRLQWRGSIGTPTGSAYSYGIVFVPDPYGETI
jgi:hypothetical protein